MDEEGKLDTILSLVQGLDERLKTVEGTAKASEADRVAASKPKVQQKQKPSKRRLPPSPFKNNYKPDPWTDEELAKVVDGKTIAEIKRER